MKKSKTNKYHAFMKKQNKNLKRNKNSKQN